jgi:hypothetical protein
VTSTAAGRDERLATRAVHTPSAGTPSRTPQRTIPWLGRHQRASRVLPSTGKRESGPASSHKRRRRPAAPPRPPPAGGWRSPAPRCDRPRWSGRVPTAAGGPCRRAARRSWSETPPRCPAAPGHQRAAPGQRFAPVGMANDPRYRDRQIWVSGRIPFVEMWEWRRSRIKSCRPRSTSRLGRVPSFQLDSSVRRPSPPQSGGGGTPT